MAVSTVFSQQIINQAWAKAESMLSDMDWRLDHAETALSGSIGVGSATVTPIAGITEPNVSIPLEAEGADLELFKEINAEILDKLVDLNLDYLSTYFPLSATTFGLTEAKLQALLAGGLTIDPAIEAQIFERDRARVLDETARATSAVTDQWAAKRFTIPPGALTYQVAEIQAKSLDMLSASSREQAIKVFEKEVEMIQFAIEAAIKARQLAIGAAGDYIKTMAGSQNTSYNMTQGKSQAQNGLINAVASLYNARTNAADTIFKSTLANAQLQQRGYEVKAEVDKDIMVKRGDVAVAAGDALARASAAMLNNLHTSVGVQGTEKL